MAQKSPLVFVDGGFSQLPPGDSIGGIPYGSLVAGSGLVGGGDLDTASQRLDVALAASPSGVIFVGDSLSLDGSDVVLAGDAYSSGVLALEQSEVALASGVAAQSKAFEALASGNAALAAATSYTSANIIQLTAASDIKAGYAVGLDDAGKVQSVRSVVTDNSNPMVFPSPSVVFETGATTQLSSAYDPVSGKVIFSYTDEGNSFYGTAIVGTVSGTSISFGTAVVFESASTQLTATTYDSTNNRIVIAYRDGGNSSFGTAIVGTVSGTSISFGTAVVFESANTAVYSIVYDSINNRVVIVYQDAGNSSYGTAIVGTVSGTSISFGTAVVFESAAAGQPRAIYDSFNSKIVIAYIDVGNSSYGTAIVGTVSGTSISFGTAVVFESASTKTPSIVYDSTNNKVVVAYGDEGNSTYGTAIVGTVSGTSISFGTAVVFESAWADRIVSVYDSGSNRIIIAYTDNGNSFASTAIVGTVSGTSISFGAAAVYLSSPFVAYRSIAFDSGNNKVVISYQDSSNSNRGTAIVPDTVLSYSYSPTLNSLPNVFGVSQSTVASGSAVNVLVPRAVDSNQTGLTTGSFYYADPTTSGFTTTSSTPPQWSGAYDWRPIAKAVSSSGLLLLDTV